MATAIAPRAQTLRSEVGHQRKLIDRQTSQIERQQAVLDVQFQRMADIQAELDLVKATVRLAAPMFAAVLIGAHPARAGTS